ncbi:unnamed protein product [Caenorhabditis brenneri]
MNDDSAGTSNSSKTKKIKRLRAEMIEEIGEGPLTVLDQALADAERYPNCHDLISARMLAVPSSILRPCKFCCGINIENGTFPNSSINYTPEEIENMVDSCSTHVEDQKLADRAKAKAELEAKLARQAKREQNRLEREAKRALAKKNKVKKKKANSTSKKKVSKAKVKAEPTKMEADEEDIDEFLHEAELLKNDKKKVWLCPECKKSSRYGSVGCTGCGEWYHFACAGFMRHKDIPNSSWTCNSCTKYYY